MGFISWSFVPVVIVVLVFSAFRILREYERGVVFMLGRFWKVKGPGLIIIIPGVQAMVKVDLRIIVMDVPPQDVISRDNVSVKVNAVVFFRVIDSRRAKVNQAESELQAAEKLVQAVVLLSKNPQALQLRYLQSMEGMANDKSNTIVFPLPMDLITPFLDYLKKK